MKRLLFPFAYLWCLLEFRLDHKAAVRAAQLYTRPRLKG